MQAPAGVGNRPLPPVLHLSQHRSYALQTGIRIESKEKVEVRKRQHRVNLHLPVATGQIQASHWPETTRFRPINDSSILGRGLPASLRFLPAHSSSRFLSCSSHRSPLPRTQSPPCIPLLPAPALPLCSGQPRIQSPSP
ncbi:hypothetical protein SKAU_G00157380 [Synaphobranchus kaupii]|uniref:Uncharacterized protein n=1 Tax=Synaphobranchus kaupii TaxID=118154 RepID=A0A9Q1FHU2_SYNKA|nr:hypothetical protein SKAU_G00157380 [Synaphobranchus kaupii]